jgi:hypothetical protein
VSLLFRTAGIGTKAAAGPDATKPQLIGAVIPAAGTTIEITFTEAVSIGAGGDGGFVLDTSGAAVTLNASPTGTGTGTLVYTLSRTVLAGETIVDFDYTQPTNGIEDAAGNDLDTFLNQQALVTNNSTSDATAPVLTNVTDVKTGTTTATIGVDTDEGNGTLYWAVSTNTTRSIAQIKAGTGCAQFSSVAVSSTGTKTVNVTGLTAATTYYAHFTQTDASNNDATAVNGDGFTTDAVPDVTAPVLTNPVDDNAGSTDGALTVDTDEGNGTLYWVISTSSSAPSKAQVKAGQMHTGSAAADSGSQAVSGTGTQTISGESGLTESTTYYAHFMHEDSSTNQSDVVSGNGFTTDAGGEVATFSGNGVFYPTLAHPSYQTSTTNGIVTNAFAMDAAAEKVAFIGTVYIDGRPAGAKTISSGGGKIHFLPGTATFADTTGTPTTIRVGIQDLDDTTGGSGAGVGAAVDGTFDVYDDLVAGTDTITTSTWKTVTMSSGTKDITHGQKIAVVFDMTSRGAGATDTVQVTGVAIQVANAGWPQVQHNTASWVRQNSLPICIIEFDDGTLGTIEGGLPISAITGQSFASNSTPDEYGLIFQLPFESTAISLWMIAKPTTNAANGELILYSDPLGTPVAEATISLDANNFQLSDGVRFGEWTIPTAVTLAANTDYAVAFRPTTTTNVSLTLFTLPDANYRKFMAGTNVSRGHRTDNAGAFTSTTTSYPLIGVKLG